MPHSQSYPVTAVSISQPHLEYDTKKDDHSISSLSGWCIFLFAGVIALTFMLTINFYGGSTVFMTIVNTREGLVPIVKKGNLKVYPFLSGVNNGIESLFALTFPSNDTSSIVTRMDTLLKGYPADHTEPYRNCWLENPGRETPCFYDVSWITSLCSSSNSFGYQEQNGRFSPCFILKLDGSEDWSPMLQPRSEVPVTLLDDYDAGFMPIDCYVKESNISVYTSKYPPKGFSHMYFPVSRFNSAVYLAPLLAVKVNGIERGQTVSVTCSIITQNAFILHNNGRVTVTITAT